MDEITKTNITDNLLTDICNIIENAQKTAIKTVNITLVMRNWLLGQRIASENMDGNRSESMELVLLKNWPISLPIYMVKDLINVLYIDT